MTIGTVILISMALLCIFTVGERVLAEMGWPRFFAMAFLLLAAVLQTLPSQIRVGEGTVSPVGVAFMLLAGVWGVYKSVSGGQRPLRIWLSIVLCGLFMLLLLMLWSRQGTWESLVPGAACGVLAALIADSRTSMLAHALLGALTACTLYFAYSIFTEGIGMLELGTGQSWNLFAVALWFALWCYEIKDAIKHLAFMPRKRNVT